MNGRRARAIRRLADALALTTYGPSAKTIARRIRRVATRTGTWTPEVTR